MYQLYQGDCLEVMKDIPDKSIDMILCDLPYGVLKATWDIIIPMDTLWTYYKRIIKDGGVIALFGNEPFSSKIRISNLSWYKYDWYWDKKIPSGMTYAKYQPMRQIELVSIFYGFKSFYYPQKSQRNTPIKAGGINNKSASGLSIGCKPLKKTYNDKNPTTLISFDKVRHKSLHPTQKPVEILEYLIKTYTLEGETVLDNCMGSGSTGIACINTNRNFVGIEKDENYFNIAQTRINKHLVS